MERTEIIVDSERPRVMLDSLLHSKRGRAGESAILCRRVWLCRESGFLPARMIASRAVCSESTARISPRVGIVIKESVNRGTESKKNLSE
jgi:hypothetical protein